MSKSQKFPKNQIATWLYIILLILLLIFISIIVWQFASYSPSANNLTFASIGLPLIGVGLPLIGAAYLVREIASRFAGDSTIDAPLPSKKKKGKSKNYRVDLTEEEMRLIIKHRRQK